MKSKLFGANIKPDCTYCKHFVFDQEAVCCNKSRQIKEGKCRKFSYDPLMRIPHGNVFVKKYSENDFKLN